MKRTFRLRIDEEEMEVTVERNGDSLTVERDGERVTVSVLGEVPSVPSRSLPSDHPTASPQIVGQSPPTPQAAPAPAPSGSILAPITGTIKEVLVTEGERISQGERVIMMEAMKMDIEVVAPSAGKLSRVYVKAGDTVKEHQPLCSIE